MEPLVSICIPAYNAEHFIADTLNSALSQTYPNLEIVVSDDCSQDKTFEIASSYVERGVKIIKPSQNLGMFGNFNYVIRCSSGKYILKLDADDLVDPEHVAEQVAVMEAYPQVNFAHCACRLIDVNGNLIGYERSLQDSFIRTCVEEWPRYVFGPRAVNIVMIRRSAFDQVGGYDERYRYSGDWAMHRSLLKTGSVFYNAKVLASYRVHRIGKDGVRLLQVKEHLMHLEDIAQMWPEDVKDKEKILRRARIRLGKMGAIIAACAPANERREIISLLPSYGDELSLRLLTLLLKLRGAIIIRGYRIIFLTLRQVVKQFMYPVLDSRKRK
ncbi:MAG: hypothetical protein OHK003_30870 [Anaerolineales bacterium]